LANKTITQIRKRPGDSHFWSGLMKVNDDFLARGYFRIQNRLQVKFWENTWCVLRGGRDQNNVAHELARFARECQCFFLLVFQSGLFPSLVRMLLNF